MVVIGKFRRDPARRARNSRSPTSTFTTSAPSGGPSVIALFLLIRDLCSKLSAGVLTGDFNKAVDRELPAGDPNGQRRLSSIAAAFNHASIPWPTYGVSPL